MVRPVYEETTGTKGIYGHDGDKFQAVHTDEAGNIIFGSELAYLLMEKMDNLLSELRVISHLMNEGLNLKEDLEDVRSDAESEYLHEE